MSHCHTTKIYIKYSKIERVYRMCNFLYTHMHEEIVSYLCIGKGVCAHALFNYPGGERGQLRDVPDYIQLTLLQLCPRQQVSQTVDLRVVLRVVLVQL
jgi:hypothetical protein